MSEHQRWDRASEFEKLLWSIKNKSAQRITNVAKFATRHSQHYKYIVHYVEKWIRKAPEKLLLTTLYVIDAIIRYNRRESGSSREVYAKRFAKNLEQSFSKILHCPNDEKAKVKKVVANWKAKRTFSDDAISLMEQLIEADERSLAKENEDDPEYAEYEKQVRLQNERLRQQQLGELGQAGDDDAPPKYEAEDEPPKPEPEPEPEPEPRGQTTEGASYSLPSSDVISAALNVDLGALDFDYGEDEDEEERVENQLKQLAQQKQQLQQEAKRPPTPDNPPTPPPPSVTAPQPPLSNLPHKVERVSPPRTTSPRSNRWGAHDSRRSPPRGHGQPRPRHHQPRNKYTAFGHVGFSIAKNQEHTPSGQVRVMSTVVWVGNLPPTADQTIIHRLFGQYGQIEHVNLTSGSCFVKYATRGMAEAAYTGMNGNDILGQACKIGWGRGPGIAKSNLNWKTGESFIPRSDVDELKATGVNVPVEDVSLPDIGYTAVPTSRFGAPVTRAPPAQEERPRKRSRFGARLPTAPQPAAPAQSNAYDPVLAAQEFHPQGAPAPTHGQPHAYRR